MSPTQVTLLCGATTSSWSRAWLEETRDRELEARAVLRMSDRDVRREHLTRYALTMAQFARINRRDVDPDAYGAEARRRLEACILERWERSRARIV